MPRRSKFARKGQNYENLTKISILNSHFQLYFVILLSYYTI